MKLERVDVRFSVSVDRIRNLLVSAFEGGSNYWMYLKDYQFPPNTTLSDFKEGGKHAIKDQNHAWCPAYVIPLVEDGGLIITDEEENKDYVLTPKNIKSGLNVMAKKYSRHFADVVNENDDADTADVFLQCCLFGEVVYG